MGRKRLAPATAGSLGVIAFLTFPGAAGSPGAHDGQVVAYETGAPLGAVVEAWTSDTQTGKLGNCPLFGDSIDTRQADDHGNFTLDVGDQRAFTVVFCADGYFPQVLPDVPNRPGTNIVPRPTALMSDQAVDDATFEQKVREAALGGIYRLTYLQSIDRVRFQQALGRLVEDIAAANPDRAKALQEIGTLVDIWQPRRDSEEEPKPTPAG
jgi:hypothetical protein